MERAVALATALDVGLIIQQDGVVLTAECAALRSVTVPARGRSADFRDSTVIDTEDETSSVFRVALASDHSQDYAVTANDNDLQPVETLPSGTTEHDEGAQVDIQLSRNGLAYPPRTIAVLVEKKGTILGGTSSKTINIDFADG